MVISNEELNHLNQFVSDKAENPDLSLNDCLRLWLFEKEQQEAVNDIQQGILDYENGQAESLSETFNDLRNQFGNSK